MRLFHRWVAVVIAAVLAVPSALVLTSSSPAQASPGERYSGTHFGAGNLPEGCIASMKGWVDDAQTKPNPDNTCYHMRTGLNGLDSPQVDVLILVPVSPVAERDMRVMRQAVEMWEGGIHYLAGEMGLPWLKNGMKFHITVDYMDPTGPHGGEFATYPIADPEIVVVGGNANPGDAVFGIGIDPAKELFGQEGPCHGVANPFDMGAWDALPGFSSHDSERGGTYTEDCGGKGGNVCFAVNAIGADPTPDVADWGLGSFFDLVAHEFGHCLSAGHVGDGAEGDPDGPTGPKHGWGPIPTNDIMAYSQDPPGRTKCVSTLDVEAMALRQSHYLDVNGDGQPGTAGDILEANDPIGVDDPSPDDHPFIVQSPRDHLYASDTGSPMHCPQPDVATVPGPRTDWEPTPVDEIDDLLSVTGPSKTESADGAFNVTGSVEHKERNPHRDPTEPFAGKDDARGDGKTDYTDITRLDVESFADELDATMMLADLPPPDATAPTSYSIFVNGREFNSSVLAGGATQTYDWEAGAFLGDGASEWDVPAKTVTFRIPTADLHEKAPFHIIGAAEISGNLVKGRPDDYAPAKDESLDIAQGTALHSSGGGGGGGNPTATSATFDDADDDGKTPISEITQFDVSNTVDTVNAAVHLSELWPTANAISPVRYSVVINNRQYDSFVRYPQDNNPMTWDRTAGAYLPAGSSVWDFAANTVTFHIPKTYKLTKTDSTTGAVTNVNVALAAPYSVSSKTSYGALSNELVNDDYAPNKGESIAIAGKTASTATIRTSRGRIPLVGSHAGVQTFHNGKSPENTFFPENSTAGDRVLLDGNPVGVGMNGHDGDDYAFNVPSLSDVKLTLDWSEPARVDTPAVDPITGESHWGNDLDLYVSGPGVSQDDASGVTDGRPETVTLRAFTGTLNLHVEPFLVIDPVSGAQYTLTANVTPLDASSDGDGDGVVDSSDQCPTKAGAAPSGCPDTDGDGVTDNVDVCPTIAGQGANGCPAAPKENVVVSIDGTKAGEQLVDTSNGPDNFDIPITVPSGKHAVQVQWLSKDGKELASQNLSLTHTVVTGPDRDKDGVTDARDNCPDVANPDQANMDGDSFGDACDKDIDGDGFKNGSEKAQGTDPRDPNSYPDRGHKKK